MWGGVFCRERRGVKALTGCRPCHRFATSSLERLQPKSFAYQDSRRSLIANCRSTFDAAAHFYRGDTMSFALPAAVPADSLVCLGPKLIHTRFNCTGFFSECFISSATDTSKDDKTPVALCLRHKRTLHPARCASYHHSI